MRFVFLLLATIGSLYIKAQTYVPVFTSIPVAPHITPVIFLDMDGYEVVAGTRWSGYNGGKGFYAEPAGLSASEIYIAYTMVAEDFRPFNVAVTTDSNVYANAPFDKRIRAVCTSTSSWYSEWNGGVGFYGSFVFGDDTPVWVFTKNLDYSGKYAGDCASHEVGHSFNLIHHGTYDQNCNPVAEYNYGGGEGETAWGPIMGAAYYVNIGTWDNGDSVKPSKCMAKVRSDLETINRYLSYRQERNNGAGDAQEINVESNNGTVRFTANGLIERRKDQDRFDLRLPARTHLKLSAHSPLLNENMGYANNLDLRLSLKSRTGPGKPAEYAPFDRVGVDIDTTLEAGTYLISVTGDGNANMSDYGSLGSFEITGAGTTTTQSLAVRLGNDTSMCLSDLQTSGYQLKINDVDPNTTVLWSTGETSTAIKVFQPGTYWVSVSNANTQPKTASDTLTIFASGNVVPGFTVSGYNPNGCRALITVRDITTSSCSGIGLVSYNFGIPGDTSTACTMAGGSISNLYDKEGTYVITQTVWDVAGHRFTHKREVRIEHLKDAPANILGPDQKICDGSFTTIGNASLQGRWIWQDDPTHSPTRTVGPGRYSALVELYDAQGNAAYCYVSDTVTVTSGASIVPGFYTKEVASLMGTSIQFTSTTTTCDGSQPSRYRWIFGDGTESSDPHPSHQYRSSGPKLVTLIASTSIATEKIAKIVTVNLLKQVDEHYPKTTIILSRHPVMNRAGNVLNVHIDKPENNGSGYQLIDVNGQVLRTGRIFNGDNLLDVTGVSKGVFVLKVFKNEKQEVFRLWKQ